MGKRERELERERRRERGREGAREREGERERGRERGRERERQRRDRVSEGDYLFIKRACYCGQFYVYYFAEDECTRRSPLTRTPCEGPHSNLVMQLTKY